MIQFGNTEQMDLMPSSATYPWSHLKFEIADEPFYLLFDPEEEDYQELSKKDWIIASEKYKVVDNKYLSSDCTKIVLRVNEAYYTLFHDLIPFVMKMFEYDPSTYFILHRPQVGYGEGGKLTKRSRDITIDFVKSFLDSQGVNYYFHEAEEDSVLIKVSNRLMLETNRQKLWLTSGDIKTSTDSIISQILSDEEKAIVPYKKAYLSRLHLRPDRSQVHGMKHPGGTNRYRTDVRIEDEEVLIDYFTAKGYEIVVPENQFSSFEEQVKYFNEVKVLVGLTGTGLSNAILMQEGQTVIDITSELIFGSEQYGSAQVINSDHYLNDSYMQKHLFVSIPSRRDPHQVVQRFNQLENLIDL